jgi:hypothetical protein
MIHFNKLPSDYQQYLQYHINVLELPQPWPELLLSLNDSFDTWVFCFDKNPMPRLFVSCRICYCYAVADSILKSIEWILFLTRHLYIELALFQDFQITLKSKGIFFTHSTL